jgi:molecular chaperone GrpE
MAKKTTEEPPQTDGHEELPAPQPHHKPEKPAVQPAPLFDEEVESLKQQVADLTAALQRERADAMNIRRRHEEQTAGMRTIVKASVVRDLLPVIDNFERALKHVPKDLEDNDFVKGVRGVVKQFEKSLADIGVERIKTVGEPFDPEFHEAVAMEDGEGDREVVAEELQAGYRLGDEIIRHAMVKVRTE